MRHVDLIHFGEDLCRFVGLDPTVVRSITVTARVGEVPYVEAVVYADEEKRTPVVRKYRFVEEDRDEPL